MYTPTGSGAKAAAYVLASTTFQSTFANQGEFLIY